MEHDLSEPLECANCGANSNLLTCTRCHTAWFCGVKCQKAYWPFHRTQCKRNEFADLVEGQEPKFAAWMRRHGKLAVLKDDEVDRIERAGAAACGPGRQDVMESMYGRLEPKPKEASYSAEERIRMARRAEADKGDARQALLQGKAYAAITVPSSLGLDCGHYKWRQNQSHVEVFVPLPENLAAKRVTVELGPSAVKVEAEGRVLLGGRLWREIKAEDSTWTVSEGVLELSLLKRNRRGNYQDGKTNADTFWAAVLQKAPPQETLQLDYPPTSYYSSPCEGLKPDRAPARLRANSPPAGQAAAATAPGALPAPIAA